VDAITPLPIPGSAGILLYGGSFDPPHVAHVELAIAARDALERQAGAGGGKPGAGEDIWLVYVPAVRSPHKQSGPMATGAQRVRMLELALEGRPRASIWTDEIDRAVAGEPSYWINTVRRAQALLGERWLRFLVGADQAVEFHRWRDAREILRLAQPAVIGRGEVDSASALRRAMAAAGFWSEQELDAWAGWFVEAGVRRASSTDVRRGRGEGELAPAVAAYVAQEGLYGGGNGKWPRSN
jgi:nicotinate-nucleotide adenylyltransferase